MFPSAARDVKVDEEQHPAKTLNRTFDCGVTRLHRSGWFPGSAVGPPLRANKRHSCGSTAWGSVAEQMAPQWTRNDVHVKRYGKQTRANWMMGSGRRRDKRKSLWWSFRQMSLCWDLFSFRCGPTDRWALKWETMSTLSAADQKYPDVAVRKEM